MSSCLAFVWLPHCLQGPCSPPYLLFAFCSLVSISHLITHSHLYAFWLTTAPNYIAALDCQSEAAVGFCCFCYGWVLFPLQYYVPEVFFKKQFIDFFSVSLGEHPWFRGGVCGTSKRVYIWRTRERSSSDLQWWDYGSVLVLFTCNFRCGFKHLALNSFYNMVFNLYLWNSQTEK